MHLRVSVVRDGAAPGLVLRVLGARADGHVLEAGQQLVLLQGVQATVQVVLVALQHVVLSLHVVKVIIRLFGHSVQVHVALTLDCSASVRGGMAWRCALGLL